MNEVDQREQIPFEEAFARLEQVVRTLEAGDVKLEESLRLFEEGVRLARICGSKLDEAEGRMSKLIAAEDGSDVEVPLDEPSEAVS